MSELITISEAAKITRLSEYLLRKLDENGSFPANKTDGHHRRYDRDKVERFAMRIRNNPLCRFDTILKRITLEQVKKGISAFISKPWENLRMIGTGFVRESDWKLGDKDAYMYMYPDLPKTMAHTNIYDHPSLRNCIYFDMSEKFNAKPELVNLVYTGWYGDVSGPPDRNVLKCYDLPDKFFKMAFLWNFGHPSLWASDVSSVPFTVFIIVDDKTFEK